MNDINFWKRTFLCGASLLLIAASPAMASGVDAMSTEGVAAVQQNGRTVTVTVNDAMGPVIGANVLPTFSLKALQSVQSLTWTVTPLSRACLTVQ